MAELTAAQIARLNGMCEGAKGASLGTKVAELETRVDTIETDAPVVNKALSGDLVLVATPATTGSSAATIAADISADAKYVRAVSLELQSAAGEVHEWFNGTFAIAVGEVTAGNGVSAIEDSATTITMVNGVGTVNLEYTGTWAAEDTQTLTVTGGTVLGYSVANKTSVDTVIA